MSSRWLWISEGLPTQHAPRPVPLSGWEFLNKILMQHRTMSSRVTSLWTAVVRYPSRCALKRDNDGIAFKHDRLSTTPAPVRSTRWRLVRMKSVNHSTSAESWRPLGLRRVRVESLLRWSWRRIKPSKGTTRIRRGSSARIEIYREGVRSRLQGVEQPNNEQLMYSSERSELLL